MKIIQSASYKHKTTHNWVHFVWFESTHIGSPPLVLQLQFDEIQDSELEIEGDKTDVPGALRCTTANAELDLHASFLAGEFKTGNWEAERPRPMIPEVPLPDPSELQVPRARRDLLDSAQGRFRKKPT